jgi:TM2 domain-containing membrane protein YozV
MIFMQITKFRFIGLFIVTILLFLGTGICHCDAQKADKQDLALGELKLEGKYIERLVLRRKDSRTERFDPPGEQSQNPDTSENSTSV